MLKIDGRKLEILMAEKLYSYRDLCKMAQMSQDTLVKIIKYKKASTTITVGKIAWALGVKPAEILKDEDEDSKDERPKQEKPKTEAKPKPERPKPPKPEKPKAEEKKKEEIKKPAMAKQAFTRKLMRDLYLGRD